MSLLSKVFDIILFSFVNLKKICTKSAYYAVQLCSYAVMQLCAVCAVICANYFAQITVRVMLPFRYFDTAYPSIPLSFSRLCSKQKVGFIVPSIGLVFSAPLGVRVPPAPGPPRPAAPTASTPPPPSGDPPCPPPTPRLPRDPRRWPIPRHPPPTAQGLLVAGAVWHGNRGIGFYVFCRSESQAASKPKSLITPLTAVAAFAQCVYSRRLFSVKCFRWFCKALLPPTVSHVFPSFAHPPLHFNSIPFQPFRHFHWLYFIIGFDKLVSGPFFFDVSP